MLEKDHTVGAFLQHRFGFFEGVRGFQFCRKRAAHALQNFAKQEEVFLFAAYQQDRQWGPCGFCGRQH